MIRDLYIVAGSCGDYRFRRLLEFLVNKKELLRWSDDSRKLLEVFTDDVEKEWQDWRELVFPEGDKNEEG